MIPAGQLLTGLAYLTGFAVFLLALPRLAPPTAPEQRWKGWLVLGAGALGGTLGAKLTQWLLLGLPQPQHGTLLDPQLGGRTIIGGIICGWLAVELTKWLLKLKGSWGDPFALALAAGECIGRLGCYCNQCCYGIPTSLPHGLPFSVYSHGAWRLPTQLYSSLAALLTFLLLLQICRNRRHPGNVFRWYLVLYGVSRFGLEFLRFRDKLYFGLSMAQWVCLELALAGAAGLLWLHFAGRPATTRNGAGSV